MKVESKLMKLLGGRMLADQHAACDYAKGCEVVSYGI